MPAEYCEWQEQKLCLHMGRWTKRCRKARSSDSLDRVAVAAHSLQLAPQVAGGVAIVGDQLFDPLRHAVLDASDLPADLLHVCIRAAVALALAPQARVLVAQVGNRPAHLAIDAEAVPGLCAGHLLAAFAAEDQKTAHLALRSATVASLSSRKRSG